MEDIRIAKEVVGEVLGKELSPLIDLLKDKQDVSEFKLAEKLKLNVNQVRNMLYKLSASNLITSIRKKDQKKGWYVYYWSLDLPKIIRFVIDYKKNKLKELDKQISNERTSKYFTCPTNCVRLNYEDALEIEFRCPECGSILQEQNNKAIIDQMHQEINRLNSDISYVEALEKETFAKNIIKEARKSKKKAKKSVKKVKKQKLTKKPAKKAKAVKKKQPVKTKKFIKNPKKLISKFGRLFSKK